MLNSKKIFPDILIYLFFFASVAFLIVLEDCRDHIEINRETVSGKYVSTHGKATEVLELFKDGHYRYRCIDRMNAEWNNVGIWSISSESGWDFINLENWIRCYSPFQDEVGKSVNLKTGLTTHRGRMMINLDPDAYNYNLFKADSE